VGTTHLHTTGGPTCTLDTINTQPLQASAGACAYPLCMRLPRRLRKHTTLGIWAEDAIAPARITD
jgi:hypothetical protein